MDNKEDKEEKEFPNDEFADNSGNQNICLLKIIYNFN